MMKADSCCTQPKISSWSECSLRQVQLTTGASEENKRGWWSNMRHQNWGKMELKSTSIFFNVCAIATATKPKASTISSPQKRKVAGLINLILFYIITEGLATWGGVWWVAEAWCVMAVCGQWGQPRNGPRHRERERERERAADPDLAV